MILDNVIVVHALDCFDLSDESVRPVAMPKVFERDPVRILSGSIRGKEHIASSTSAEGFSKNATITIGRCHLRPCRVLNSLTFPIDSRALGA